MPVNHKIEDVLLAAQEFVRQQCIYADNFYIYRQSIDARHKKSIKYILLSFRLFLNFYVNFNRLRHCFATFKNLSKNFLIFTSISKI